MVAILLFHNYIIKLNGCFTYYKSIISLLYLSLPNKGINSSFEWNKFYLYLGILGLDSLKLQVSSFKFYNFFMLRWTNKSLSEWPIEILQYIHCSPDLSQTYHFCKKFCIIFLARLNSISEKLSIQNCNFEWNFSTYQSDF